jgi:hypothetical protein
MNKIQKSYGEWFESLAEWDWFATFTFKYPTSPRTANHLWRKWLHSLEREVNGQVHFVRVLEDDDDNVHYHCLLAGVRDQKPSVWERVWHNIAGIAQITPYINGAGGAEYIGKKAYRGCDVASSKHIEKARLYV